MVLPVRRVGLYLRYGNFLKRPTSCTLYTRGLSHHNRPVEANNNPPSSHFHLYGLSRHAASTQVDFNRISLEQSLSRLSLLSMQSQLQKKYSVPFVCQGLRTNIEILDPQSSKTMIDCPGTGHVTTIIDPLTYSSVIADPLANPIEHHLPGGSHVIKKEASTGKGKVIQRRRRKMKRHQYKKFLKRSRFLRWRIKQARERRKQLRWQRYLESLKFKKLYARDIKEEIEKRQEEWSIYQRYVEYMKESENRDEKAVAASSHRRD